MKTLLCSTALFLTVQVNAQIQWVGGPSCPGEGRYWAMAAVVNGKAYAGTGQVEVGGGNTADFWEFDPLTDAWTAKADFPGGARSGVNAFAVGDRFLAGFGTAGTAQTTDFHEYLPGTDEWVTLEPVPGQGFAYGAGFVIDNTCYVGPELGTGHVYAYDAQVGQWSQVADFPGTVRTHHAAFAVNGKGYWGGGREPGGSVLGDWWSYDPVGDVWTEIAPMTPVTDESSACVWNGAGYVFNVGSADGELYRYDEVNDAWVVESAFPFVRLARGTLFAIGDRGYHVFGLKRLLGNMVPSNELWSFGVGLGFQERTEDMGLHVAYRPDGQVLLTSTAAMPTGTRVDVLDISGRLCWSSNIQAGTPLRLLLGMEAYGNGIHLVDVQLPERRVALPVVFMAP